MKPLSELLHGIGMRWTLQGDASVQGIQVDSRKVQPGDLFVALIGTHHDGHQFLHDALARGAAALLVSDAEAIPPDAPAWAWVEDTRDALWRIAQRFYDNPSRQLVVVGVTGTNGKTTTTHLLHAIFEAAGLPCALIGTLGATLPHSPAPPDSSAPSDTLLTGLTTPEVFEIQLILSRALAWGARAAVMEVSSHALDQRRADGVHFDAAIFTNLTQDHLDYHPSMEAYAQAKLRLFTEQSRQSEKPFRAVINLDAEWGAWFAERAVGDLWTYGVHPDARVRAEQVQLDRDGIHFVVHAAGDGSPAPSASFPVQIRLTAPYNLQNALGAVAAALSLGLPIEAIQQGLLTVERVPGRFERVPIDAPFEVIVDYAHTPDALARLLSAARALQPSRLTVLFGCGGDRDRTKRPKMGAIAAELADRVILTSDNPRTEPPERILQQILEGVPTALRHKVVAVEPDRREAIALALQEAIPGEMIIMAGKGHEEYQIIGTTRIPFSDRETVLELSRPTGAKQP
ncbi:MAG: UDP-N-acetylmuramoyl-L-alanyl-D-glutamate--2,6-diaminopimelate ligase [Fimbriimonadales bacterium]|nr:UDP-N-acetylmuramoyl-L-alanyl-D-glutamate--2,6-diaminopimelate ligase [Fimbriimonadales bacterium]